MTAARTALARLHDGDWHLGKDLATSGNTLAKLAHAGKIEAAREDDGYLFDRWRITGAGMVDLDATQ